MWTRGTRSVRRLLEFVVTRAINHLVTAARSIGTCSVLNRSVPFRETVANTVSISSGRFSCYQLAGAATFPATVQSLGRNFVISVEGTKLWQAGLWQFQVKITRLWQLLPIYVSICGICIPISYESGPEIISNVISKLEISSKLFTFSTM